MARYTAIVDGHEGAYGVTFPDLPGCTSMGATVDEALQNAVEAVSLWVGDAIDDGEVIPEPRAVEDLLNDPEVRDELAEGGVIASVPLLLDSGRPAKANISLDAGLLRTLDETATAYRLTRSAFIASAIREKIATGFASETVLRAFDLVSIAEDNHPSQHCLTIDDFLAMGVLRSSQVVHAGRYAQPVQDPYNRPINWIAYVDVLPINAKGAVRHLLGHRR